MKSTLANLLTNLLENPEDSSTRLIIADCLREFHGNHKEVETYARLIQEDLSIKVVIDILMKFETRKIRKEVSKCLREFYKQVITSRRKNTARKQLNKTRKNVSLVNQKSWVIRTEASDLKKLLMN